jgi:hypothetical protein
MEGKFRQGKHEYEWWAGKASNIANSRYCVHCFREDHGATLYMDEEPDENTAEQTAQQLVSTVDQMSTIRMH